MKLLPKLFLGFIALTHCIFAPIIHADQFKVTRVTDGDTIKVSNNGEIVTVRLVGLQGGGQGSSQELWSRHPLALTMYDLVLQTLNQLTLSRASMNSIHFSRSHPGQRQVVCCVEAGQTG